MRLRGGRLFLSAGVVASLAVVGCATTPKTPEEIVAGRSQARLDALMAGDLDTAIEYSTPGYRESFDKGDLASAYFGVRNWTSAEVDVVVCEVQRCVVKYIVEYEIRRPKFTNRRPLTETWVLTDGQWYVTRR